MPTYLDLLLRDTIAGSMLRSLMLERSMPQRDFMRLYHERCGRANAKNKSSFGNSFDRFVARERVYWKLKDGEGWAKRVGSPIACIGHDRRIVGDPKGKINVLLWDPPCQITELIADRDNAFVESAEASLERIALKPRSADFGIADEAGALLADVRRHVRARPPTRRAA